MLGFLDYFKGIKAARAEAAYAQADAFHMRRQCNELAGEIGKLRIQMWKIDKEREAVDILLSLHHTYPEAATILLGIAKEKLAKESPNA
jgi:hypothetical protein